MTGAPEPPAQRSAALAWVPGGALLVALAVALAPVPPRAAAWLADLSAWSGAPASGLQQAVVIDLDEASLQGLRAELGSWPYGRDAYVPVVRYLQGAGARVVAFNLLFADPRPGDATLGPLLGPGSHVVLAAAGQRSGSASESAVRPGRNALAPRALQGAAAFAWPALVWPTETLRAAARDGVGVISAPLDADGVLRRLPVLHREAQTLVPALPVAALLAAQPGAALSFDATSDRYRAGQYTWAVDNEGNFRVPLPESAGAVASLPFADVYRAATGRGDSAALRAKLRGRAVFIGSTAAGGDSVPTPRGMLSGTELQALAYAALASGSVPQPAGAALTALLLALALVPAAGTAWRGRPTLAWHLGALLLTAAVLLAAGLAMATRWHVDVPLAGCATVLAAGLALTTLAHARAVRAAQRQLDIERAGAEAAARAKNEFLANVSHEIRTPLSAMLGISELLAESPLHDEQRAQLEVLRNAGGNLAALINDLLDLARIDAGRLALDVEPFELRPLLLQQMALVSVGAERKGLRLTLDVADNLPAWVRGDAKRLGQVLLNLLGNAVKFTREGGITVVVRRDGSLGAEADSAHFEVRDTGMGIAPAQRDKIFEPFTQADSSVTREFGGSGLGLTITQRLVLLMGGRIDVQSQQGVGSAFSFTARLPATAAAVAVVAAPAPAVRRGLRILLAEDQPANVYLVQAMLRDGEHAIDVVGNGQEAIERWRDGRYDVLLMDLQMPLRDGLSATREIRRLEAASGRPPTPVLALSANAFDSDVAQSLAAGCNAHLSKPFSKAELLNAMGHHAGTPATASGPAAAALGPALAQLARTSGFDVPLALQRLGGDQRLYSKVLGQALIALEVWRERFVQACEAHDMVTAQRAAHDLKSMAATLGAQSLSLAALGLETALREGRPRADAEAAAASALETALPALRRAAAPAGPGAA